MLSQTCLDNIEWTIFLCNAVPAWSIQHCIGFFPHEGVCLPWANIAQVISLCNFDPERSGHHCRLFSSAKLFVDCAMIGEEMIDPLSADKEFFFLIFKDFFVWKQRFGVCLLLILHKQIYLNIIKWFTSISTLFLRNQSVVFQKNF